MGRKSKRLGRSNVIWWPSVKSFLQANPDEYYSAQEIIDRATLVGRNSHSLPLYRSRSCPSLSTIGKFLKVREMVDRKKVSRRTLTGSTNSYAYRWIGNDCD